MHSRLFLSYRTAWILTGHEGVGINLNHGCNIFPPVIIIIIETTIIIIMIMMIIIIIIIIIIITIITTVQLINSFNHQTAAPYLQSPSPFKHKEH